jgi:hypothetical protein
MTQRRIVLTFVLVLLLVAGVVAWQKRPVRSPMRLTLTGTPGLKVTGTTIVDGVSRKFNGVLPASIDVEAREFEYMIRMQEPQGALRGELTVVNAVYGSSNTADDYTGVHGMYAHTWMSDGRGFMTTVQKEE